MFRAVTLAALLALSAPAHAAEFTCDEVRWWAARFTQAQLEAMASALGHPVTDADRKRGNECLKKSKERK